MHSSTSNFKRSIPDVPWLRILAIAATVAVALICAAEITLRSLGYTPTVVDDPDLWSLERSRVGSSTNSIVLIGNSQMMWSVSPTIIKEYYPNMNVRMLAVEGSSPVPVLADLAADSSFRGIVLCAINPIDILPLEHEEQENIVKYYYRYFSLNKALNRQISNWLQWHLVFMDPYASPKRLIQEWLTNKRLPGPRPVITYPDRSRRFDYTLVNVENRQNTLYNSALSILISASLGGKEQWFDHASKIADYTKAIISRGGMVIYFRFPLSDNAWQLEEYYFPRDVFWNSWDYKHDEINTVYFKDTDCLNNFYCPDYYHIDSSDVVNFTHCFVGIFSKIIKP